MVKNDWSLIQGKKPILLVASHNYPQIRKSYIKPGDMGTGFLVETLCKNSNAWGIITTKVQLDPNWYANSPFRKRVKQLIKTNNIKFVLDIHGRREDYPHLLELLPNNSFNKRVINLPKSFHVNSFVDNEQLTLAEDLDKKSIACAEIEIRKDGRIKEINKENYLTVIKKIVELLRFSTRC